MALPYFKASARHGTRGCYVSGCRCDACRKANTTYYHSRQKMILEAAVKQDTGRRSGLCPGVDDTGCPSHTTLRADSKGGLCIGCRKKLVWNGTVPADQVRVHLFYLSKAGVGRRRVAEVSGISPTILQKVKVGLKNSIRADTEKKILAVGQYDHAPHALVPAKKTWRLITKIQRVFGLSKAAIAEELGYDGHGLQIRKYLCLRMNAWEVEKLWNILLEEKWRAEHAPQTCMDCGLPHVPEVRQRVLKRMLPCTIKEVLTEYPCLFAARVFKEGRGLESRALFRDLHALGAASKRGVWELPRAREASSSG